ncbi:MAG: Trm112 family protein [Deltaproteobacteria bacterium]|nr:Trm112 family protein [Deltaproteobacteria bacterium]
MTCDPKLYDILVCPKCRGRLQKVEDPEGFVCASCELFYAIDEGLPNMLIDEAKRWPLNEGKTS